MRAYQNESAPIVFLLHIIDGFLDELEIITADASEIKPKYIEFDKVEYDIDKDVQ